MLDVPQIVQKLNDVIVFPLLLSLTCSTQSTDKCFAVPFKEMTWKLSNDVIFRYILGDKSFCQILLFPEAACIKLQSSFIEITLQYGCSPVNLLHIFRTPFPKNTSGWLFQSFRSLSSESWLKSSLIYLAMASVEHTDMIFLIHLYIMNSLEV